MDNKQILKYVDHTLLKPTATWEEMITLCEEAMEYETASVCIPPSYVKRARQRFANLNICTVIGFPLGYSTTQAKLEETVKALEDGADEIDMVINLGDVKNGDYSKVQQEVISLKRECRDRILKVIVETCYLTEGEKIELCRLVTDAGADYIKTSTGYGSAGAQAEDISLFREYLGSAVKIKASGGIKTKEAMERFLELGCERIGTSSAMEALVRNDGMDKADEIEEIDAVDEIEEIDGIDEIDDLY